MDRDIEEAIEAHVETSHGDLVKQEDFSRFEEALLGEVEEDYNGNRVRRGGRLETIEHKIDLRNGSHWTRTQKIAAASVIGLLAGNLALAAANFFA